MSEVIPVNPIRTISVPEAISALGPAAEFAYEDFFDAHVRNSHTRAAYRRAVSRFLAWLGTTGRPLPQVTPGMVGAYFDSLPHSVATKKLELSALRAFFDVLVTRHVVVLNPAGAVRGERYSVCEGRTPEVTPEQARRLLASVSTARLGGLRDRAVIACLIYTAGRARAVARLQLRDLQHDAGQYVLRFAEKGGRQREIPVRHDLQDYLFESLTAAGFEPGRNAAPLFQSSAVGPSNSPAARSPESTSAGSSNGGRRPRSCRPGYPRTASGCARSPTCSPRGCRSRTCSTWSGTPTPHHPALRPAGAEGDAEHRGTHQR